MHDHGVRESAKCGWWVLVCWQVLAIFITGTGAFSQLLAARGVNIPTTQSLGNYILLSLNVLFLTKTASNRSIHAVGGHTLCGVWSLSKPWWWYFLLAIADVEGNFFLVKAYQYTTITSVQLLDCFTIPCVMLLSRVVFGRQYSAKHLIGSVVCTCGLAVLVVSDVLGHRNASGQHSTRHMLLGDTLVLVGCMFYAISNIGQEYLVAGVHPQGVQNGNRQMNTEGGGDESKAPTDTAPLVASTSASDLPSDEEVAAVVCDQAQLRHEYLTCLGVFGTCITVLQASLLERQDWYHVDWSAWPVLLYLCGFTACLCGLYTATPVLLQRSSAVIMNLSFLTADFWSVILAVFVFDAHLNALYFIAFTVIIAGLIVYNTAKDPTLTRDVVQLSTSV